jgi:hypothetical protein
MGSLAVVAACLSSVVRRVAFLSALSFALATLSLLLAATGCGGATGALPNAPPDAGAPPPANPPLAPLSPAKDGGGMTLTCAPGDGVPVAASFPRCTFVDAKACQADAECGCGCSCQCGVCNCNAAARVGDCAAPAGSYGSGSSGSGSPAACCSTNDDCGPSCYGLACVSGQCVPGAGRWTGTWKGTFSWPTASSFATCDRGIDGSSPSGYGTVGGPMTVVVVGDGSHMTVLLESERGSGQPLCALPFVVAGDTATLVPGSACVRPGLPDFCKRSPPVVTVQTFTSGTATLSDTTLSLEWTDIFTSPATQGPECDSPPSGLEQVSVESMEATLEREGG